jgi:hypothetical protein
MEKGTLIPLAAEIVERLAKIRPHSPAARAVEKSKKLTDPRFYHDCRIHEIVVREGAEAP